MRLARSLRPDAGTATVGASLASMPLPQPQSAIAGETIAWSQSLIWGTGALRGEAMFASQQGAYAQSLIWGIGRLDAWGAGVTYYDGLFSQDYVAFGQNNEWSSVTWDGGTSTASGLIWTRELYASGVAWQTQTVTSDFFDPSPTSLIWGVRGYGSSGSGLIWGIASGAGLIWGAY